MKLSSFVFLSIKKLPILDAIPLMRMLRKNSAKVKLLYLEEHTSCKNYISDYTSGFSAQKILKGNLLEFAPHHQFIIVFMLEGELEIMSELGEKKRVSAGYFSLLNYETKYLCRVLKNAEFAVLYFEKPKIKCDKYTLLSLAEYAKKDKDDIRLLKMVDPLNLFVNNLMIYLDKKLMCRHLHDLKESEWIFIMRGFYTKEQNAYLLEPIINSLNDFATIVRENYLKCRSVQELAELCNMSEKTFTRRFKEYFNDTPKQWIMREKGKYIKSDLDSGKMNIKEVANKFGFSSSSHLNNYYKKQFHTTPRKKAE